MVIHPTLAHFCQRLCALSHLTGVVIHGRACVKVLAFAERSPAYPTVGVYLPFWAALDRLSRRHGCALYGAEYLALTVPAGYLFDGYGVHVVNSKDWEHGTRGEIYPNLKRIDRSAPEQIH